MILDKETLLYKITSLDWLLIALVCAIFTIGIVMLYSASNGTGLWAYRQMIYFCIFFPLGLLISTVDINFWYKTSYINYFIGFCLLLIVEIKGYKSMGATRWINLGFFKLQPSELMKISLVTSLARYFFSKNLSEIKKNKTLIIPLVLFIIPFVLILKQPNLGTALILMIIFITLLFLVGVQFWKFILCLLIFLALSPVLWKYGIKDYQKQRILTFLNPSNDPLKSGYNITQSKIAIGSGFLKGKGFYKGTQGHLEFLPEKQTDFIFTLFAEEFGFIGCIIIIMLYVCLFSRLIFISTKVQDSYCRLIIIGFCISMFSHFFINIGMVTGILPVVGTPLPLMSYGGSITASTFIFLGFVLSAERANYYNYLELK